MLIQDIPMIDIYEPHKSMSNSKDNTPKHREIVHEAMIVPNSATHNTNVYDLGLVEPYRIGYIIMIYHIFVI